MLKFPLLDVLPAELAGIIYDFWWDQDKLHLLKLPQVDVPVKSLEWHLDLRWWQYQGRPFQITPRQVLENPSKYHEQYNRTKAADLAHPIIIRYKDGRIIIVDGVHRLLKAVMEGRTTIQAAVFSDELVPLILRIPAIVNA